jgi:hypothetical protein
MISGINPLMTSPVKRIITQTMISGTPLKIKIRRKRIKTLKTISGVQPTNHLKKRREQRDNKPAKADKIHLPIPGMEKNTPLLILAMLNGLKKIWIGAREPTIMM